MLIPTWFELSHTDRYDSNQYSKWNCYNSLFVSYIMIGTNANIKGISVIWWQSMTAMVDACYFEGYDLDVIVT